MRAMPGQAPPAKFPVPGDSTPVFPNPAAIDQSPAVIANCDGRPSFSTNEFVPGDQSRVKFSDKIEHSLQFPGVSALDEGDSLNSSFGESNVVGNLALDEGDSLNSSFGESNVVGNLAYDALFDDPLPRLSSRVPLVKAPSTAAMEVDSATGSSVAVNSRSRRPVDQRWF
jgi:hypothetical protein